MRKQEDIEAYINKHNFYIVVNVRCLCKKYGVTLKDFFHEINRSESYFRDLKKKKNVIYQNDMNKVINFFKEKGCNISHDELVNNYLISN